VCFFGPIHTGNKVEFNPVDFVESRPSTQSTLCVSLAPYTLATKLNVSATKSTATNYRIQVVADLLPKLSTKSTVLATKSTVSASKLTVSATLNIVADLLPFLFSFLCGRQLLRAALRPQTGPNALPLTNQKPNDKGEELYPP